MASSSAPLRRIPVLIPDYMQEKLLEFYEQEETRPRRSAIASPSEAANRIHQEETLKITHGELRLTFSAAAPVSRRGVAAAIPNRSKMDLWDCSIVSSPRLILSSYAQTTGNADPVARDCYESMQKIDVFFREQFDRPPVLNANQLMTTVVHHPQVRNNCFWTPEYEAVFMGEWDARHFNPPTRELSIITHEFGHAVTHYSSGLQYLGETGALNEAVSDIFAIMHQHRQANVRADNPDASWLIAENLVKNRDGSSSPLRSMIDPGTAFQGHFIFGDDEQVGHVRDMNPQKWTEDRDHGGVHIYSGIPNRAFYLMSTRMGGPSWEKPGKIWFNTLMKAEEDDNFIGFATRTCEEARLLYDVKTQEAVAQAWVDVGVDLRHLIPKPKSSSQGASENIIQDTNSYSLARVSKVVVPVLVLIGATSYYYWK